MTSRSRKTVFIELAQELPCDGRDVQARWVAFQTGLIKGTVCTFVVVEVILLHECYNTEFSSVNFLIE